ncbi:chemotaxis protein CheB [Thermodesulfomicrobium sp. WS]|uniref:chemotaxis protein CheB n=1 Tax=Thermodesulfomicrobium sp. WS TaxID=3004129 RepID=UPI00249134C7|nr:chemotaxis protein CheB [Thermodesulfomicrobium sp. WS]BDV01913.1 chemotaxis protein CheB [Thermodesulfomicrobium sp. WS]
MSAVHAVVLGASAGGLTAIRHILAQLRPDFGPPILIVQHIAPSAGSTLVETFRDHSPLPVMEAEDKTLPAPGTIYLAPPDYHLQVEPEGHLSLCLDERVRFARPSIDVLFTTAADAFCPHLAGVLLTGANDDGAQGLWRIHRLGGITLVQDPATAKARAMPEAALALCPKHQVFDLDGIATTLNTLVLP